MNFLPKSNFELEIKARIKAESKPEPTSNIETIAKKVVSSQNDVQEQEDYKAKDGFNIKVEINDGELKNGLFILQTLKCGNEVKEVKNICFFWVETLCQGQKNSEANFCFLRKKWLFSYFVSY